MTNNVPSQQKDPVKQGDVLNLAGEPVDDVWDAVQYICSRGCGRETCQPASG
jgi:hypothetical protein